MPLGLLVFPPTSSCTIFLMGKHYMKRSNECWDLKGMVLEEALPHPIVVCFFGSAVCLLVLTGGKEGEEKGRNGVTTHYTSHRW